MRKFRAGLSLLLVLCLMFTLAGCGEQSEQASTTKDQQGEVRIIHDDLGRDVEVPDQPQRVLAMNASMTEMVYQLGVVPVGKVSEYVIDHPETKDLPGISFENNPNIEMINKLEPDLIIAHAKNHAQILENLEATGVAVVCIDPLAADDQLIGRADLIGEALNREKEAAAYVKEIEEGADKLREKLAESPVKTAIFIQGGGQDIRAAQSFCFWGRLLGNLGIENIVPVKTGGGAKAGFINFDMETIIQKDPDAILILQPGFKSGAGKGQGPGKNPGEGKGKNQNKDISPEELMAKYQNDPMWQQLSAVKNNRLYIVPDNIAPGKIGVLEALEATAKLIEPEAFK